MPCPCHAPTMPFFSRPQNSTAIERRPCCGLEKNGMVGAWHGDGMASVNQTRPRCVNQMGKTHSKPLAARHSRGTAWARHGNGMLCVNRPLKILCNCQQTKPPLLPHGPSRRLRKYGLVHAHRRVLLYVVLCRWIYDVFFSEPRICTKHLKGLL